MESAYVTARGRIVIPARLRRKLGIKQGTKVSFIEHGNEILLQPLTKQYIRSLCGMLKSIASPTKDLLRERRKDKKRERVQSLRHDVHRRTS
jgi:AbrB family looped-hinge helix DNA binding protein